MICPNCGTTNREIARFCKECGRFLAANCPNCGSELPQAAKYCDICGHHLASTLSPRASRDRPSASPVAEAAEPALAHTQLDRYIPKELLTKLTDVQNSGGMVGELRVVTMLFCDVKGSTAAAEQLDPEEWREIINGAFERMIAPVYRYEGTVARLMGDGILAFFGAPIAHEDDAVRAILAGLEIVDQIKSYQRAVSREYGITIDVRVGINTGRVVVGAVGSDLRLEYTALGDAINVAARMEQTASPGTVQIAENTYHQVSRLFDFEDLGGIIVKGKTDPVKAYRALAWRGDPGLRRGIAGLESPLVGRTTEVQALTGALNDLTQGRGQIIFLVAEAGLGKTRLLRELYFTWQADELSHQAVQFWLHQPVASYQTSEAYRMLRNQIRLMIGAENGASTDELNAKLVAALDLLPTDERPRAYQPLAQILGISNVEKANGQSKGEAFKRKLFAATLAAIRAQTESKPAIFAIDDLHWIDPISLELSQHLFQLVDTSPILFICTARLDRSAASWDLKTEAEKLYPHRFRELQLEPLTEQESLLMLDGLLAGMEWPTKLNALILDKADGNPFFIEEVVRALIDSGIVKQQPETGRWYADIEVSEVGIPDNLQALLAARIDRLADEDRQTLQLASVIGRSFSYQILERISQDQKNLERSLANLQRVDLIEQETTQSGRFFRFRNTLAQETVYRSILRKQRRTFHRQIGEAILELDKDQPDEQLPALAHHFYKAGDLRGLAYNQRAGDEAYHLYANQEAATYYGQAIQIARQVADISPEQLGQLYLRRGRALELDSRFAEALATYHEMAEVAGEKGDQAMNLAALVGAGTLYSTANVQFEADQAEKLANQALALAQELGDEAAEAKINWNLLNVYRLSQRPEQALKAGKRSLTVARRNNLREQLAYTANDLSHVYMAINAPQEAIATVTEAIALWRELENLPMLADSLATASLALWFNGDYEKIIAMSDEAYRISLAIENVWGQSYSRFAIGFVYWQLGEPAKAIEMMEICVQMGKKAGFLPAQLHVAPQLALAYAHLGAIDRALKMARPIPAQAKATVPFYAPIASACLLQICLLAGEFQEAESIQAELMAIDEQAEPFTGSFVQESLIRYHLARGNFDQAMEHALVLKAAVGEMNARGMIAPALLYHGQALMGSHRLDQAGELLDQALARAQTDSLRWFEWQILAALADLERARGNLSQAETVRSQARSIFEEIADRLPTPELQQSFVNHAQQPAP